MRICKLIKKYKKKVKKKRIGKLTRNIYCFPYCLIVPGHKLFISPLMCKWSLNCRGSLYSKQPRASLGLDPGLGLPRLHLGLGGMTCSNSGSLFSGKL